MSEQISREHPENKSNLYKALQAAQTGVKPVEHDAEGYAGRDKISYVSAETLIDYCRQILLGHDLVALRRSWTVDIHNDTTCLVRSVFSLQHVPSKEWLEDVTCSLARAEHGTPLDKAANAALTTSLAYWLRDILLVPRFHPAIEAAPPAEMPDGKVYDLAMAAVIRAGSLEQLKATQARIEEHETLSDKQKEVLLACCLARQVELVGEEQHA